MLVLGNLYRVYKKLIIQDRSQPDVVEEDSDHPVTSILESIEKRWLKADQDLFIVCWFLNPFLDASLRNQNNLPLAVIMGIVRRMYERAFKISAEGSGLMSQVFDYAGCEKAFSETKWPLKDLKSIKEFVGLLYLSVLICCLIILAQLQDGSNDPVRVWRTLNVENPLVKLAILVLSFVPNSASTERIFSSMGDIKTKKRNKLGVQKLRDCALVKGELRHQHAKDGTARVQLRRKFGNGIPSVADTDKSGSRMEDEDIL